MEDVYNNPYEEYYNQEAENAHNLLILLVCVLGIVIGLIFIARVQPTNIKAETLQSYPKTNKIAYTSNHYKTAAIWLSKQGITTTQADLEEYSHEAIDGDVLYGVLRKGVKDGYSSMTLLRLEGYSLFALPSGSLIVFKDKCVIFNGGTADKVRYFDSTTNSMMKSDTNAFETNYISSGGISYLLIPRGYSLDYS